MLVCVCVMGGIIDMSLNPVLQFFFIFYNSVDITSVETIKNCTGFDLSQLVSLFCFFSSRDTSRVMMSRLYQRSYGQVEFGKNI